MKKIALLVVLAPLFASSAAQAFSLKLPPNSRLSSGFVNPSVKALNPQPLPPSPAKFGSGLVNPAVKALNPQPLPPRWQPSQFRFAR